ncbi:MAG: chromosome segregation ATPase [Myxococcota bacterium]|jgi:chromosome segregation ATPase
MFSFLKIELMNWDLWDHVVFPMDEQVVVVSGPNGSGKTTLLDSIRVLLGSKTLSTSRKMSGYLRDDVKLAVIKAQVSNPLRRGHGRRPFTRKGIFEDTATLACVIQNKSGAWHRKYFILPGDASMEDIRAEGRGMGPEEYAAELRAAGLPRTLLKILALEQGETHALCRRTPAQLLEYVLEMQGDKAVLDSYDVARQNYAGSRQEHAAQNEKAREAERALELTARDAQSYQEFRAIQDEVGDILARRLPAARWHQLQGHLNAQDVDHQKAHDALARFEDENADRIAKVDQLERDTKRLAGAITTKKSERLVFLKDKEQIDGRAREVRVRLTQLTTLKKRAADAPKADIEELQGKLRSAMLAEADAERKQELLNKEKTEIEAELGSLGKAGRVRLPNFVNDMTGALRNAGIDFSLVAEVVEITDPKWQKAVESVLGKDRFTVLVEPRDNLKAREIAAQCRYPAYVAALGTAVSIDPPKRSALSVVKLAEKRIPHWISARLADTQLVNDVKDGFDKARSGASITADGYRQDSRGGVYVGVDSLYCGGGASKATAGRLREQLVANSARRNEMVDTQRATIRRRAGVQMEVEAIEARVQWAEAESEFAELEIADVEATAEKRKRAEAIMDVLTETEELTRELAERQGELRRIRMDGAVGDEERRRRTVRLHEIASKKRNISNEIEKLTPDVAEELRSEAAGELLESQPELRGRLAVLQEHEENYEGYRDEAIIEVLARQKAHLDEQNVLLKRREAELRSGEGELRQARVSYIRVADATISRYAKALKDLSARAGMDVDVRRPKLVEDDEVLRQAGLDVHLGFDGKKPIAISDPKLSGGQKVLASLLLLVALTYEGEEEGGGFFILDEPFAHLSVERIDHVARFIGLTKSQFLLTTPTTHNFAVFNAARLLLTLRKKKPSMAAAPPPLYARA